MNSLEINVSQTQHVRPSSPPKKATRERFPERNAEIVRRRKAGEWPRAIARSMGISHNVVIGVCNRAGLSGPAGHMECRRKLSAADVAVIRRDYLPFDPKAGASALARRFGVTRRNISLIVMGRTWKHVA